MTFSGTTNLDKWLSRFIVLGDVTYLLEFFFFLTEYSLYRMLKKEEREREKDISGPKVGSDKWAQQPIRY